MNVQIDAVPTAHITIGKNRQKVYSGNRVFLDANVEFEIELFNPTDKVILAKIIFNGTNRSNTGLVLNPGVRVFLDRFIDDQKRMKFDVYEVDKNDKEVDKAIANNGLVRIEFYEEETNQQFYTGQYYDNIYRNTGNDYINTVYGNGTDPSVFNNYTTFSSTSSNITYSTTSVSNDDLLTSTNTTSFNKLNETKETGRIDKGSNSDQVFTSVNKNFKLFAFHTVEYKLLPKSEKPVEVNEIRVYCTECGTRRRNDSWKFCPKCGYKYE